MLAFTTKSRFVAFKFYQFCKVFWIEKTTYLLGMQWECCWECQLSAEFARLKIGVAFATIFRSSSFSGVSPKKVTITQTVMIVLIIIEIPQGKFLSGGLGIFAIVF